MPVRGVLSMCGLVLASSLSGASDANAEDAARALPKAVPARFEVAALGKPVLVSRADVESPLGRVRSLQLDGASNAGEARVADPAFKAVLLTPRESTGRPVQPAIPLPELASGPAHVDVAEPPAPSPAPKGEAAAATAEPTKPAKPKPTQSASKPRPGQSAEKGSAGRVTATAERQAGAPPARPAPVAKAASPAPVKTQGGFGRAEIAATRAFTRF